MKSYFLLIVLFLSAVSLSAQSKRTSAADYKGTFSYAVAETNAAFPFVFTVQTQEFAGGKVVSSELEVHHRQAEGVERTIRTTGVGATAATSFQVSTGFGNVYCSNDGTSWKGPQEFECSGPSRLYGPRTPEKSEYSVEVKVIGGKEVKVYREYVEYRPRTKGGKKEFKDTIATIDSRGFFVSVVNEEGTLDPRIVTLTRRQRWDFVTRFKPIVAPK